jgi:hypothetical protein
MTTSLEEFRVDPDRACRSCAHPKWRECACFCCVADEEAEFAEILEALGYAVFADGEYEEAGACFDAADKHQSPPEGRLSARISLLLDAMSGQEAGP